MFDYHIHTPLCSHAEGSPRKMLQAAFDRGLKEVAFLDHLTPAPLPGENSMAIEEVGFYFNKIKELAYAWKGKIRVLTGLEIDYHPDSLEAIEKIKETYDFDIIAGSVHFVEGFNIASRSQKSKWFTRASELYRSYLKSLYEMVQADFCDMICHIDLMEKFAPEIEKKEREEIDTAMDKLLKSIAEKKLVIELNSSGLRQAIGRPYPSLDILKKCRRYGIMISLSSDAHSPEFVGAGQKELLELAKAADYTEIAGFEKRKVRLISLT